MSKPDQNASAAERLAGFHVGEQYELINLIGEGAYGTVW
jgi:mitogen-activated protein kinase 1/3